MTVQPSFFAAAPEADRADDLFAEYTRFLEDRNGPLTGDGAFARRELMMEGFDGVPVDHEGRIDPEAFRAAYVGRAERDAPIELLALLAFVKINVAEAYGVEVTGRARAKLLERPEPVYRVEKVLLREEYYHTRMLVGAAKPFGLVVEGAWKAPWPLQLLLFCLAQAPASFFHPILLGAEISGVFQFNWVLNRLNGLFPDAPEVRETMERRMIEVLIDEVGHIAYNRIALAKSGLGPARRIATAVAASSETTIPELTGLGFDSDARRALAEFDYRHLPEEVRRRAFFV